MKLLFVDDESKIIESLKRLLYSMRNQWEMHFANSGTEALEILKNYSIDVVVTDLRMPAMNGIQLLSKIKQLYPDTIRIILSGYSDKEMIIQSIEVAHQYLSKPCNIEVLKKTIIDSIDIKKRIIKKEVQKIISKISNLPSLPSTYQQLLKELELPDVSLKNISKIISNDISMTIKILQLVNSSFFGINKKISSIEESVHYLGIDTIKSLILSIGIFSQYDQEEYKYFSFKNLIDHCCICAIYSKKIAQFENSDKILISNSFYSGLLHDIGKLIIAINFKKEYIEIQKLINLKHITTQEAEKQVLDSSHEEIGAYLASLWGLPDDIINVIAYHHSPDNFFNNEISMLSYVHAANYLFYFFELNDARIAEHHLNNNFIKTKNMHDKIVKWKQLLDKK